MFARRKIVEPWEGKMEPFRIIGNVYFVGTFQASCHLIDTGEGLILVDPGYSNSLYLVIRSIYKLGFSPEDIKYILLTHWHNDHTEATRAMVDLSGAKTLLGHNDVEKAKPYVDPDILIKDGDTLTLGNTTIRFKETPGQRSHSSLTPRITTRPIASACSEVLAPTRWRRDILTMTDAARATAIL